MSNKHFQSAGTTVLGLAEVGTSLQVTCLSRNPKKEMASPDQIAAEIS